MTTEDLRQLIERSDLSTSDLNLIIQEANRDQH